MQPLLRVSTARQRVVRVDLNRPGKLNAFNAGWVVACVVWLSIDVAQTTDVMSTTTRDTDAPHSLYASVRRFFDGNAERGEDRQQTTDLPPVVVLGGGESRHFTAGLDCITVLLWRRLWLSVGRVYPTKRIYHTPFIGITSNGPVAR